MPSRRDFLVGLGAAGTAGTAGCLGVGEQRFSPGTNAESDWPMSRFNPENDAFAPDAVAPREGVAERWSALEGLGVFAPAVVDGTVYVSDRQNGLLALDGATGDEHWRYAPGDHPAFSQPMVHDGIVYVGALEKDALHAIDAASGEKQWTKAGLASNDGPISIAPNTEPAMVFSGTERGELFRLRPDGTVTWSTDLFGPVTTLSVRNGTLYVGTASGELYAYGISGNHDAPPDEYWRTEVGPRIESITPTSNGVITTTFGGPLTNIGRQGDATDPVWVATSKHAGSPPVHAGSWLYSAGYDSVSGLREYDKNLHWREKGSFGSAGPVSAGDTLYVPGDEAVHAYDLDGGVGGGAFSVGTKRWSHELPQHGIQGLAVGTGALFVACESGKDEAALYCLEEA